MTVVVHFVLAVVLFFLVNWIGGQGITVGYQSMSITGNSNEAPAFNFVFRFLSPLVYLLIIASILYYLNLDRFVQNIYFVVVYYFVVRLLVRLILGRAKLVNWWYELSSWIITTFAAYFLYDKIISTRVNLLPDFTTIANELWIIVFLFIYQTLNRVRVSPVGEEKRRRNYVHQAYQQYKKQFSYIVDKAKDERIEALAYAIMIYESFNRPNFVRWLERNILFPIGRSKTLGIMQITTKRKISDAESIRQGVAKISNDYTNLFDENIDKYSKMYSSVDSIRNIAVKDTIRKYNNGIEYYIQVSKLYDEIVEMFYPNLKQSSN